MNSMEVEVDIDRLEVVEEYISFRLTVGLYTTRVSAFGDVQST